MIGNDAFCPRSGASLSEEQHYDETGTPKRAVTDDDAPDPPVGELTNGAYRSSTTALAAYFRRCHQRYDPTDDALYREVALGIRRLSRAASGRQAWDVHVWFALQQRLADTGHDVDWMGGCATLRCPGCHGRLRYVEVGADDVVGRCGARCSDRRRDRLEEVRDVVADLYTAAFDERPSERPLQL